MKLNPDCMRNILFYLEEHLTITNDLEFQEISVLGLDKKLNYPVQELANTALVLYEAGLIEAEVDYGDNHIHLFDIYRITYDGYQFIESIRPQSVWEKIKIIGSHIGSFSIDVISQIATGVLTSMIEGYLTGQLNL